MSKYAVMPHPQLKKRTYGYLPKRENSRERRTYGEERRGKGHKGGKSTLLFLLALPFRLLVLILRGIWTGLSWLWGKRPRLANKTKRALFKQLVWTVVTLCVLGLLGGIVLVAWASRDLPDPDRLTDRQVAQSTKIYDRTGEHLLYEIFANQKRTLVKLDEVPKQLVNGLIATEDKIFYEHRGIRPLSMARALFYGVFTKRRVAGTSTLTQQLVKNAILTNERTLTRKIREVILSIRLEQKYTKDQILQIYFNEIPYGSTNYGVEAAAQSYFGKHVSDLTLAESATLAGLPKQPSIYLGNMQALKNRRDFVLQRMWEEKYITEKERDAAQAEPLNMTVKQSFGDVAPHFVMYVKQQLVETYGEQTVEQGGLKVITTLDWEKQQFANEAVSSSRKILLEAQADNAALLAIDPKTGHILAMVGSRDYNDQSIDGNFNVATQGLGRQPGSSMKPIIYAAAFSKGYTPDTVLFDVSINFAVPGAKEYRPGNYDGKEHGPVTIRQALQNSYNIPAVQTLYLVGDSNALALAKKLGYTTLDEGNFGLSLVLGGATVHLLDHTVAYAAFANDGIHHDPVSIVRVEDKNDDVLKEWKPDAGERVLDPQVTATLSNILSDDAARAPTFGAGSILTLGDRPVAAKTGTTNDYKDGWTVGYTPSLAAGVWIGKTDNTPLKPGYGGSKVAGVIWNSFMKKALVGTPVEQFPSPPPNTATKPILRGAIGGSITLPINRLNGKIATSSTPGEFIEERTYIPAHSILHYVNKNDPNGPPPEHPELDPQYFIWEAAIQEWTQRKKAEEPNWNVNFEDPPTEYDEAAQSPELLPTLDVFLPAAGSIITSPQLTTDIHASAPRGVSRVVYQIDNQIIATVTAPPFNMNATINTVANGPHSLIIRAEDDVGNMTQKIVPFVLNVQ